MGYIHDVQKDASDLVWQVSLTPKTYRVIVTHQDPGREFEIWMQWGKPAVTWNNHRDNFTRFTIDVDSDFLHIGAEYKNKKGEASEDWKPNYLGNKNIQPDHGSWADMSWRTRALSIRLEVT